MENVLFFERHGNIAPSSLRTSVEEKVPLAVAKTLGLLGVVGRFNAFAMSHEIKPLSVQHWSSNALHATLFLLWSRMVMMVMGWRL